MIELMYPDFVCISAGEIKAFLSENFVATDFELTILCYFSFVKCIRIVNLCFVREMSSLGACFVDFFLLGKRACCCFYSDCSDCISMEIIASRRRLVEHTCLMPHDIVSVQNNYGAERCMFVFPLKLLMA